MGELALYGLLAVLIAGGLFLLATRFLPAGEQIAPPLRDEPPWELPGDRMLNAEDVDSVRLPVALRGYRFAETDLLLDRLAGELRARDGEIARLRGRIGGHQGASAPASSAPAPRPEPLAPMQFRKPEVAEATYAPEAPYTPETPEASEVLPREPRPADEGDLAEAAPAPASWAPWAPQPGGQRAETPPPFAAEDDERR